MARARPLAKADPDVRYLPAKEDNRLCKEIARVHSANLGVYGARTVCLQLNREGVSVGRDLLARLMARYSAARAGRRCAREGGENDRVKLSIGSGLGPRIGAQ